MAWRHPQSTIALSLILYLLVVGVGAGAMVVANFPKVGANGTVEFPPDADGRSVFAPGIPIRTTEQGIAMLAFAAGVTGSFLHAAQSLATYIGNAEFKTTWTAWYVLRPWIGGILGMALYFVFSAGLILGADTMKPHGVVAVGLLGGWFSKTTTDKLQEVFETLFRTDADRKRKDKLQGPDQPVVEKVEPSPVPASANELTVTGQHFVKGITVSIGQQTVPSTLVSDTELKVTLTGFAQRPTGEVALTVKNTEGTTPQSEPFTLSFS